MTQRSKPRIARPVASVPEALKAASDQELVDELNRRMRIRAEQNGDGWPREEQVRVDAGRGTHVMHLLVDEAQSYKVVAVDGMVLDRRRALNGRIVAAMKKDLKE